MGDGKSTKIHSLSRGRVAFVFVFAVIPRILIAAALGVVGVIYLLNTLTLSDMLLNCMCLAFVVDIDELLFDAFAPKRVRFLLDSLEPLEYPHKYDAGLLSYSRGFLIIFTAFLLVLINVLFLSPT